MVDDQTHKPEYECDMDGETGRQRALEAMIDVCDSLRVCPACSATGALYLAATAWINSLGRSRETFLDLAQRVFDSVEQQRAAAEATADVLDN